MLFLFEVSKGVLQAHLLRFANRKLGWNLQILGAVILGRNLPRRVAVPSLRTLTVQ